MERKEIQRVAEYIVWNTGTDQFKDLRRVMTRVKEASKGLVKARKEYEQARKAMIWGQKEENASLSDLVETYLKEVPIEMESVILMTLNQECG